MFIMQYDVAISCELGSRQYGQQHRWTNLQLTLLPAVGTVFLICCDSQSETTGLFKGLSRTDLNAACTRQKKKKSFRCFGPLISNMLTIRCENHGAYRWSIVSARAYSSPFDLMQGCCDQSAGTLNFLKSQSVPPLYCQWSWSEYLN